MPSFFQPRPFSSADGISDDDWDSAARQWRAAQGLYGPVAAGSPDDADPAVGFDPTSSDASQVLGRAEMPHAQWQQARAAQLAAKDTMEAGGAEGSDDAATEAPSPDTTPASGGERVPSGPETDLEGAKAFGHVLADGARAAQRFAQRQMFGSTGEQATSDNPVVRWAQDEVGSGRYNRASPAQDARGRVENSLPTMLKGIVDPKCNQFVYDALAAGGAPPGRLDGGRIPIAHDWGDPQSKIAGYAPVSGAPQAGDVVSNGEHVGIYAPLPNGRPGTISAASPDWPVLFHGSGGVAGGVVHNDWGFRPGQRVTLWRRLPTGSPR
jgi:hypothetical protein